VAFISHRQWFRKRKAQAPVKIAATLLTTFLLLGIYTLALVGIIYIVSLYDYRMEILVTDPLTWAEIKAVLTLDESVLLPLAHRLVFLERMVYWFTGWHIFNDHPWLGVGLGNAGFFALDQTPAVGWASYEIRMLLFHLSQLPNIKSIWVRLLAETGLVGFSVFISWLVVLFRSAYQTLRSHQPILRTLALAGQLSLIAFIGEGFSIDSFAMPYFWVTAGLIAAAGWTYRQKLTSQTSPDAATRNNERS
jgi:O-antigen ligase